MKNFKGLLCHVAFWVTCIFLNSLWAQDISQKEVIKQNTDTLALKLMSQQFRIRYNLEKQIALEAAIERGWPIYGNTENDSYFELQKLTPNGLPVYYSTTNFRTSAPALKTNEVRFSGTEGLQLSGEGLTAGIWDAGGVRTTHREFNTQGFPSVIQLDTVSFNDHATHVAGTMAAGGFKPGLSGFSGMAPKARLNAYGWNNDASEMANEAANGLLISNHSYGLVTGWYFDSQLGSQGEWAWNGDSSISVVEDYRFGFYDQACRDWDQISYAAPYYLIVVGSGNDRMQGWYENANPPDGGFDGFDCISSFANSKNSLTVGAFEKKYSPEGEDSLYFSSIGPCDDGRIKPDICGHGWLVGSSMADSDNSYNLMSGTSMATASISGSLLLLQEYYNDSFNEFMKASTLKGLAIHGASPLLNQIGPNYKHGWGVLDMQKSTDIITNRDHTSNIIEESLVSGGVFSLDVTASGLEPLVVTLVWTDPEGNVLPPQLNNPTPSLINDLDLLVVNGASVYEPYVLDKNNPSNPATNGDNDVDNVEKIFIQTPGNINYQIQVSHEGLLANGAQNFSLIVSGVVSGKSILETQSTYAITHNSAKVDAKVLLTSANPILERGVVYDTSPLPTINSMKVMDNNFVVDSFTVSLANLLQDTRYYVRAYAVTSAGVSYGNTEYIITSCMPNNNIPYSEDFESTINQSLPNCWRVITEDGFLDPYQLENYYTYYPSFVSNEFEPDINSSPITGNKLLVFDAFANSIDVGPFDFGDWHTMVISPLIDLSTTADPVFSFWYYNPIEFSSDVDEDSICDFYLEILYRISPDSNWIVLDSIGSFVDDWTEYSFPLSQVSAQASFCFHLKNRLPSTIDPYLLLFTPGPFIDDILISGTSTIGLEEYKDDSWIMVNPNPTEGIFSVNSDLFASNPSIQLTIFDSFGKYVRKVILIENGGSVDVSDLQGGMYILQFVSGDQTLQRRMIIE